jgi:hypothetical protein
MVEMPVREEKNLRLDAVALEPFATTIWRIEKDGAPRGVPEIAIRLKDSTAKCLISHAIGWWILIRRHF